MHYYVYQITNLCNGKIYVGKHKSSKDPLSNGYYGSGKQIKAAIEKYGLGNFKKEILHYCSTLDEMSNVEARIVTEDFVKRLDTYNMHKGGPGGWDHYNGSIFHTGNSRRGGQTRSRRDDNPFKDPEWQQKFNSMKNIEFAIEQRERARSQTSIDKRKDTFRKIGHSKGNKNSQFGKVWISNVLTKEVKRITMNDTIEQGWVRGKKGHLPKKCWMNNGITEHYIFLEKEDECKNIGFICGRLKQSMPQNRMVV